MAITGVTKKKIDRLILDHFPWGQQDHPMAYATDGDREAYVKAWLGDQTSQFHGAALGLVVRVQEILWSLENQIGGRSRFFARIDMESLQKTPEGILEKMVRGWDPDACTAPPISFNNFDRKIEDLSRFRVVTNFLSDVAHITRELERPYVTMGPVSREQEVLRAEYLLKRNRFEDLIQLMPSDRKKGERCKKGIFYPQDTALSHLKVEVQICTILAEAWDKKDHFLIYEPRRRGESVQAIHEIEIFAMSELLYVADLTFDRLREDVLSPPRSEEE